MIILEGVFLYLKYLYGIWKSGDGSIFKLLMFISLSILRLAETIIIHNSADLEASESNDIVQVK